MTTFSKIYLSLVALAFIGTGAFGLSSPQALTDYVGTTLTSVDGFNETRGLYGGVHLMVGLLLMFAAFNKALHRIGLLLALTFLGGYVFGRLASISLDGMPGSTVFLWLGVEAVGSTIALFLLYTGRHRGN